MNSLVNSASNSHSAISSVNSTQNHQVTSVDYSIIDGSFMLALDCCRRRCLEVVTLPTVRTLRTHRATVVVVVEVVAVLEVLEVLEQEHQEAEAAPEQQQQQQQQQRRLEIR